MSATQRNVGRETEQLVARYLRQRGLAGVERAVRTGWRSATGSSEDTGDLTGWPGVCVQVKSLRPAGRAETETRRWLAETEAQRRASGATVGLLVVRRWGTTDVGRWWAFLMLATLLGALGDVPWPENLPAGTPLRLELSDLVTIMQARGWAPYPATDPEGGA